MRKRIYVFLLGLTIAVFIYFLAKYSRLISEDIKNLVSNSNPTSISEKINVDSISLDILKFKPIYTTIIHKQDSSIIYCIANDVGPESDDPRSFSSSMPKIYLYGITKIQGKWILNKRIFLYEDLDMVTFNNNFEVAEIGANKYLYFSTSGTMQGNAMPGYSSYSFYLISISGYKIIDVTYNGYWDDNSKLKSEYLDQYAFNSDWVIAYRDPLSEISDTELKNYLKRKIKSSNEIYEPTADDFNINHIKNFREKWKFLNRGIKFSDNSQGNSVKIETEFYNENIFPRIVDVNSNELIHNSFYAIHWFRNSDILVFDKRIEKYFPIWVDDCVRHCSEQLYFISDHVIEVINEFGEIVHTINLETKILTIPTEG